jgi:hypothetical protein
MITPTLKQAMDSGIVTMPHGFNVDLAHDAQPTLITTSSSGIPSFLTTYFDPKIIPVLFSPMKAVKIVGDEVKKGDWTSTSVAFPVVESTGETATYGDFSENSRSGVNINFPERQPYTYQTITEWGELQLEKAGAGRIDYATQLSISSVLTLNKFQNKSYFYGISGLQNYGLLNDPSLSAAIVPTTKAATGTSWSVATPLEIIADIQKAYAALQGQTNGLVDLDSPMALAMSSISQSYMVSASTYNVNVMDILFKSFPNLRIETAPEYSTASGELVQLIVTDYEGQKTASCAFTEKLRAHPVIVGSSSFKQKKSQGTIGTVIYRPLFITQMLGV